MILAFSKCYKLIELFKYLSLNNLGIRLDHLLLSNIIRVFDSVHFRHSFELWSDFLKNFLPTPNRCFYLTIWILYGRIKSYNEKLWLIAKMKNLTWITLNFFVFRNKPQFFILWFYSTVLIDYYKDLFWMVLFLKASKRMNSVTPSLNPSSPNLKNVQK